MRLKQRKKEQQQQKTIKRQTNKQTKKQRRIYELERNRMNIKIGWALFSTRLTSIDELRGKHEKNNATQKLTNASTKCAAEKIEHDVKKYDDEEEKEENAWRRKAK